MTLVANNLFLVPLGERMAVVRPLSLGTDWAWEIVHRDDPSIVVDFSAVLISNATRHVFTTISADKYTPDEPYELRIKDSGLSVVETGDFQVTRAVFGADAAADFHTINAQVKLALGLSGMNTRVTHSNHDRVTGIPLRSEFQVYVDENMVDLLAKYVLLRRLSAVGLVIGEVMFRTEYDPSAIIPCPSSSAPSAPF